MFTMKKSSLLSLKSIPGLPGPVNEVPPRLPLLQTLGEPGGVGPHLPDSQQGHPRGPGVRQRVPAHREAAWQEQ